MRPIFILGVPRSGTTLLRTLLDSHPHIACGPECPWIAGRYGKGTHFKALFETLRSDLHGPVRNYTGVGEAEVARILGRAVSDILMTSARARGKKRWAEKTPVHLLDLDFLHACFPEACFVHIVRDGRDVACSAFNGRESWGGVHVDVDGMVPITRPTVLRIWGDWLDRLESARERFDMPVHELRYEDLVARPEAALRRLLDFLEEPYDARMVEYAAQEHDFPSWEKGSSDVVEHGELMSASVGRWRREFPPVELREMTPSGRRWLRHWGYAEAETV